MTAALCAAVTTACTSTVSPNGVADVPATPTSTARTSAPPTSRPPSTTPPSTTATTPSVPPSTAAMVFAGMSEAQRVGQLFMVGATSQQVDQGAVADIRQYGVGSVILDGTSYLSASATKQIVDQLRSAATGQGASLFVATDQEGGEVQRMQGSGFSSIPSALNQGQLAAGALRQDAQTWGTQLTSAGINVDLAPVGDTVPSAAAAQNNPPIGQLDREYGFNPSTVAAHVAAFVQGMRDAGVDATVKHFPGLGRVTGNTDTTSGVTDSVTTANDPYLQPFQAAIAVGVPFVMMSTAIYSQLDPGTPAAFSHRIVTGLLRDTLGFTGVVISDDLGAAAQVSGYSVANRAVDFIQAGGDMVLTIEPGQISAMASAVLAKANADPAFAQLVNAAAMRVLQAKQAAGLLGR